MNKEELKLVRQHGGTITAQELRDLAEQAKKVSLQHRNTFEHELDLVFNVDETFLSVNVLNPEFRNKKRRLKSLGGSTLRERDSNGLLLRRSC